MLVQNEIRTIAETYLHKVRNSGPENIMAVCPFHVKGDGTPENTPSFAMSLRNGLYLCHSCGAKGNLRKFLKSLNVSPVLLEAQFKYILEAAEEGAAPPPDPIRPKLTHSAPIDERLLGLLNYCPTELLRAGFSEESLKLFEVGFDSAHNRVTFPMRDLKGQLVGISGRAIYEEQVPRYKIYDKEYENWKLPVRVGWDKRTVLYNAHRVYPTLFHSPQPQPVVVVEGFKACIWVHQAGLHNVVALIGSYLSWEHKWILQRFGGPVYLFLDNNRAGWAGTLKAVESLRSSLPVYVMTYPERLLEEPGAQPDSCSPEEIITQYQTAEPWYKSVSALVP